MEEWQLKGSSICCGGLFLLSPFVNLDDSLSAERERERGSGSMEMQKQQLQMSLTKTTHVSEDGSLVELSLYNEITHPFPTNEAN